jgi:hypothetical protein
LTAKIAGLVLSLTAGKMFAQPVQQPPVTFRGERANRAEQSAFR